MNTSDYLSKQWKREDEYRKAMKEGGYLQLSDLNETGKYETPTVVAAMMRSRVANSLFDSSIMFGYQYQKNAVRDFSKEEDSEVTIEGVDVSENGEVEVSILGYINLYHYMTYRYEYCQPIHRYFREWEAREYLWRHYAKEKGWTQPVEATLWMRDVGDEHEKVEEAYEFASRRTWLQSMNSFAHSECQPYDRVVYTYNFDHDLSQDIQYLDFFFEYNPKVHPKELEEYDQTDMALIQVHNGADARGGLTDPVGFVIENPDIFMELDFGPTAIFGDDEVYIEVQASGYWYSQKELNAWLNSPDQNFTFVEELTDEQREENEKMLEAKARSGYYLEYDDENIYLNGEPFLKFYPFVLGQ